MKKHESAAAALYTPQTFKSFDGALYSFLERECPQLGGDKTRQVLVRLVSEMVRRFYPETDHLKPGQTVWATVNRDCKGAYGKRIADTPLTTVVLDLVQEQDAAERAAGKKLRDIKTDAIARMCIQAYEQGGCLTSAELAILLKISPTTVSRYVADWEMRSGKPLPRRGTIHDMGPTFTHKKIIIDKLFIQQKSVQQTARETYHSPSAINRYINGFRQVLLCRKRRMNTAEIAYATHKSRRLVKEYERIIDEYAERSYVLERLLAFEPHIENNLERWANEYGSTK